MIESRQHFRSPILDSQIAVITVGHERLPVKIVEESSGGLSIIAKKRPEFPCESFADLHYADGHCLAGQIKYVEPIADGFRIGFQRREMINATHVDLRETFPIDTTRGIPAVTYAVVLLAGLGLGWLWTSDVAAELGDYLRRLF